MYQNMACAEPLAAAEANVALILRNAFRKYKKGLSQ
jgi:hypothetical protein